MSSNSVSNRGLETRVHRNLVLDTLLVTDYTSQTAPMLRYLNLADLPNPQAALLNLGIVTTISGVQVSKDLVTPFQVNYLAGSVTSRHGVYRHTKWELVGAS